MKDVHDIWNIHADLELSLAEFEKLDYLTNNLLEISTPIDDEQTATEKVQNALRFYESRKDMSVCVSLLMDTIDSIKESLTSTTENLWNLHTEGKSTEQAS